MPATGTGARIRRDPTHPQVRFAFKISRSTLLAIKHLALERDMTASDLVQEWVTIGLAGGFDHQAVPRLPHRPPVSQFPVMLTPHERAALQDRCVEEDLSGAQLVRRWVAHGLHHASQADPTSASPPA